MMEQMARSTWTKLAATQKKLTLPNQKQSNIANKVINEDFEASSES
jgi:hypothetical protein